MRDGGFASFLLESFALMGSEAPGAYAELCGRLARRRVRLIVDGDDLTLEFTRRGVAAVAGGPPSIEVRATQRSILDLVDARRTLVESVLADEIELRGAPEDLLVFHEGLMAYVHGAVRAPSVADLLRSYRSHRPGDCR
ncbi:MAG TPA: hypothetical protein VFD92_06825 [Candidatus Binatia bacterium]|nr:hypothetical protein [Candidatus Binatia bacterium]